MKVIEAIQEAGRSTSERVAHPVGEKVAASTIQNVSMLGGIGITAAISAGLSQMEYESKRHGIKKFYKQELAAKLGKSEDKVKDGDIDVLAKGSARKNIAMNRTFAEEIAKSKKERNLGIATIFAATLAAIAIVSVVFPATLVTTTPIFIAKAVTALIAYGIVKKPLQTLGNKIFGIEKKTTHERIERIHQEREAGKAISREEIFSVFVSANPEIDQFIVSRYGKSFDELNVADKLALTDAIGSKLNVNEITADINHGRTKVTELAFIVDGDMSGVLPTAGEEPKHHVLATIKEKLHDVGEKLNPLHHHEEPARSFVERTGRAPISTSMGHVERLQQSRESQPLTTQR